MKPSEPSQYEHGVIEQKWQKEWEKEGIYKAEDGIEGKENFYQLVEFSYPSGNLHVGHWYAFSVPDIYARYKRMQGFNVLYPMGFDAFGLPAENAAIKNGGDPKEWTEMQMTTMRSQLKSMGAMFDWSREIVTCSPEYYRWTQWMFMQFLSHDLVYRAITTVNWCPKDQTVLANEQVTDGKCERCGSEVVQREQPQWMLRITKYADRLIDDLDGLAWPHAIKESQRNWIGRSEGSEIIFQIKGTEEKITVFTTRADTLFGVTYIVLAPEHPLVESLYERSENKEEISDYIFETKRKSELDRQQSKEKTGIELKGVKAINPANNEEVPVWIADYVLAGYGTGAVMAVPAHDERDFEFAQLKSLPLREVIESKSEEITLTLLEDKYYKLDFDFWLKKITFDLDESNMEDISDAVYLFIDGVQVATSKFINSKVVFDVSERPISLVGSKHKIDFRINNKNVTAQNTIFFITVQRLINSEIFNDLIPKEAKNKITEFVDGKMVSTYRLRDWGISRQRYWGTPIPIVYDPQGNAHPVPDEHLPWLLPTDVDHTPDGTAPLARSKELFERTERIFGAGWKPEVETMDTFVDSSWYFYRYLDNKNDRAFASPEKMAAWMPIDLYMGGAEHTTMHLLYSRFWVKALHDIGLVKENESYTVRRNRGLILGPDGNKMSKSKGNVINPDEIVERLGADTVRMYLAFMGPYGVTTNYPWDPNGVVGVRRFLERVWKMRQKVSSMAVESIALHKATQKMTQDIEEHKYNTAIAQMMIVLNEWDKQESVSVEEYKTFLRLLAPFAPHITEELWHVLGEETSIHLSSWPSFDPSKTVNDTVTIGVQINGKLRDEITVAAGADKESLEQAALALPKIREYLTGKTISKVIVVPKRIINIVIKE